MGFGFPIFCLIFYAFVLKLTEIQKQISKCVKFDIKITEILSENLKKKIQKNTNLGGTNYDQQLSWVTAPYVCRTARYH